MSNSLPESNNDVSNENGKEMKVEKNSEIPAPGLIALILLKSDENRFGAINFCQETIVMKTNIA